MDKNYVKGHKLTWGTRVSYAGGDVACNVIFGMIGTLLTLFILIMLESIRQLSDWSC